MTNDILTLVAINVNSLSVIKPQVMKPADGSAEGNGAGEMWRQVT